jgi:hypothetical protein
MEVRLDVPDWRSDAPFYVVSDRRLLLAADCDGVYVSLAADAHGLRALAVALLSLAGENVPVGTELLLDSFIGMTGDVPHLLARRTEEVE